MQGERWYSGVKEAIDQSFMIFVVAIGKECEEINFEYVGEMTFVVSHLQEISGNRNNFNFPVGGREVSRGRSTRRRKLSSASAAVGLGADEVTGDVAATMYIPKCSCRVRVRSWFVSVFVFVSVNDEQPVQRGNRNNRVGSTRPATRRAQTLLKFLFDIIS